MNAFDKAIFKDEEVIAQMLVILRYLSQPLMILEMAAGQTSF